MVNRSFLLFDLDGTLTDPALGITNSVMYALQKLGAPVEERSFYYRFIGPPLLDSFAHYCGFSPEKSRAALRLYREYFADKGIYENTVYDGIPALLADLQRAGYKLIVATSKPEIYAKQIFDHFDMAKYFSFIGGADLEEIAVPDQKADAEQDHQNGKHRVDDVVDMGLTLLLLLLELLFTETLTARVLAGLLLSGCTHSLFSPLVQLAMRVVHDRTFLDII